jgi:hypothetical protein
MDELNEYNEFQKRMEEKFPKMLSGHYGGFAVSKGWWHILESAMGNIQNHLDWKATNRQRQVELFNAREQGFEAVLKFYQGKSAEPSDWHIENAEQIMEEGVVIPAEVPQVVVEQIKEKFGGLRFYYQGGDEHTSGVVDMAESWAAKSCETCGAFGTRRGGGWIRTLCDVHEAELQARKQND